MKNTNVISGKQNKKGVIWTLQVYMSNVCPVAGADNFYDAIEDMIGYRPNGWMKWSWTLITPVLCVVSVHMYVSGS